MEKQTDEIKRISRQRIREVIDEYADGSQQRFADDCGVAKASVSQYVGAGYSNAPGNQTAAKIARRYNLNPLWIMGFNVPKKLSGADIWNQSHTFAPKLNETEYTIIKKYRMMDSYGKKSVETIVNMEYTRSKSQANIMDSEDLLAAHSSGKLTDEQLKAIDDFKNSEE